MSITQSEGPPSQIDRGKRQLLIDAAVIASGVALGHITGKSAAHKEIRQALENPMSPWRRAEDPFKLPSAAKHAGKFGAHDFTLFNLRAPLEPGSDQQMLNASQSPNLRFETDETKSQVLSPDGDILFDSRAIEPDFRFYPSQAVISPDGRWLKVDTKEVFKPTIVTPSNSVRLNTIGIDRRPVAKRSLLIDRLGGPASDITDCDTLTYIHDDDDSWFPVTASWNYGAVDRIREKTDLYEGDNTPLGIKLTYYKPGNEHINTDQVFLPLEMMLSRIPSTYDKKEDFTLQNAQHRSVTVSPDGKQFALVIANGNSIDINTQEVVIVGDVHSPGDATCITPDDVRPPNENPYLDSVVCLGFLGDHAIVAMNSTSSAITLGHSPTDPWIKSLYVYSHTQNEENRLTRLPLPQLSNAIQDQHLPADLTEDGIMLYYYDSDGNNPRLERRLELDTIETYIEKMQSGQTTELQWPLIK